MVCLIIPVFTTLIGTPENVLERQSTENGNLSNTALQQAEVAAALSQGRINAGVAQVLAHQAAQEASRAQLAELARLEQLAAWSEGRTRANAMAGTLRDAASRNRTALRDGLLLRVPSFYTGSN